MMMDLQMKSKRVSKQAKIQHDLSQENSEIEEVAPRVVKKKYSHYVQLMRQMGEFDWANVHDDQEKQYPIHTLSAATVHFMLASQYFNCDQDLLHANIIQIIKIVERSDFNVHLQDQAATLEQYGTIKLKNKKYYEPRDDEDLQQLRNMNTQDIENMESILQKQFDELVLENRIQIKAYDEKIPEIRPYLIKETVNGLLRDIAGLTDIEKKYMESLEMQIQEVTINQEQGKSIGGITTQAHILDDALCLVCNDGDYQEDNLIVFCSKCNISVHQKCYLIDEIPYEDWICDVCQQFGNNGQYLRCAFCPKLGGAMKPCKVDASFFRDCNPGYYSAMSSLMKNDELQKIMFEVQNPDNVYDFTKLPSKDVNFLKENPSFEVNSQKVWVHLSCFYWSPECFVDEKTNMLKGIENISPRRFLGMCAICNTNKSGVCISCARSGCQTLYHIECARRNRVFLSISAVSGKCEYQLYCHKHIPLKVKRLIDAKNRQYEREIMEFFVLCERMRNSSLKTKKPKPKPIAKIKDHSKENELAHFALKFQRYLKKISTPRLIVNLQSNAENQYQVSYIQEICTHQQPQYKLQDISELIDVQNQNELIMLPFYKSTITTSDQIWGQFVYKDYDKDLTYQLYEKVRRQAGKLMQHYLQNNSKAKLIDMFMSKKYKKLQKERKKDIKVELKNGEEYIRDDNFYCICRKKFREGDPMIQCERCEEWMHFECLGLKLTQEETEKLTYYCFLCTDDMNEEDRQQYEVVNQDYYDDIAFKLQRQIAIACGLAQIRSQRLEELELIKQQEKNEKHIAQLQCTVETEQGNAEEKQESLDHDQKMEPDHKLEEHQTSSMEERLQVQNS